MHNSALICRDEERRNAIRRRGLNGLDFVEVIDDGDQRRLCVHLFGPVPDDIVKENVIIEGGRRIRGIRVVDIGFERDSEDETEHCLRVVVDKAGDFSDYTLRLVALEQGRPTDRVFPGFDPRYAHVRFNFRRGCPSDLDCKMEAVCPPPLPAEPEINYLAKDYASFRQLILDRLALIMPTWREQHVPDSGIALVELLAYVGDHLSYYQDAAATEAYLDTARHRISVRRHVRLIDYVMHDGCNARAWLCLHTDTDVELDPTNIFFITGGPVVESIGKIVLAEKDLQAIPHSEYEVFEPVVEHRDQPISLHAAHNRMFFYTWGDAECCLPRGATRATLHDPERTLRLREGDMLILAEVIGPRTGDPADANPDQRHVVRLTKAAPSIDELFGEPVIEIEWAREDALPFPLCLSVTLPAPDCRLVEDVSVACGNVLLVDHGRTIRDDLGVVPVEATIGQCQCDGSAEEVDVPGRFRPTLRGVPLTFSDRPRSSSSATRWMRRNPRRTLPQISLTGRSPRHGDPMDSDAGARIWSPCVDLVSSQRTDRHFVVEMDDEGLAHLRFGDGELGLAPEANTRFAATYRVGNGPAGNVGAETISYLIERDTLLSGADIRPRNPLPAQGGTPAELVADARMIAPSAFRKELMRAITADDYARLAERGREVQKASAALRWTGSWPAVRVAVDPFGTDEPEGGLLPKVAGRLHRYRRMGHDLWVDRARYVPLDIVVAVDVQPHHLRAHVKAAVQERLSHRVLADGSKGFFHPDNLSFGENVHLSWMVAAVQAVAGVVSVRVTKLERLFEGPNDELERGILRLSPLEIAQVNNDPNYPEHGQLIVSVRGGR